MRMLLFCIGFDFSLCIQFWDLFVLSLNINSLSLGLKRSVGLNGVVVALFGTNDGNCCHGGWCVVVRPVLIETERSLSLHLTNVLLPQIRCKKKREEEVIF